MLCWTTTRTRGRGAQRVAIGGPGAAPPAIGNNMESDVGQGRLLPTTSVDQYAATLASWFGVAASDLPSVLPNLGNYNPGNWNRLRLSALARTAPPPAQVVGAW